jgi:hypothetical protein
LLLDRQGDTGGVVDNVDAAVVAAATMAAVVSLFLRSGTRVGDDSSGDAGVPPALEAAAVVLEELPDKKKRFIIGINNMFLCFVERVVCGCRKT